MTQIINKKSTTNYDKTRLNAAVAEIARSNRIRPGDADNLAARVMSKVESWLSDKNEITSYELRLQTALALADFDADAAYLYENENKLF